MRKSLFIGVGVLLVLAVGAGLVFASDSSPTKEPETSPFFEATLQQAVNELDGQARAPAAGLPRSPGAPDPEYTQNPDKYPQCYTRDLASFPWCHYTTDPALWPDACSGPYPTKDYTWQAGLWPDCGPAPTQDPAVFWCDPLFTHDPGIYPMCGPEYTQDPTGAAGPCDPLYTWDAAAACPIDPPWYTQSPDLFSECDPADFTKDPSRWKECHFTYDAMNYPQCMGPLPTQDYTSSPAAWWECPGPNYTDDPVAWAWCAENYTEDVVGGPDCIPYTSDQNWPFCLDSDYTTDPQAMRCHYTSDTNFWDECQPPYPTTDWTLDTTVWPQQCTRFTEDETFWRCSPDYTIDVVRWPWCDPMWTWDAGQWPQCAPGYTYSPDEPLCQGDTRYTSSDRWPECVYVTADPGIWPECHWTSDPALAECGKETDYPTQDYTVDLMLWPECQKEKLGDLGDAPDSTNHAAAPMLAYPPAMGAHYPSVYDPATGLPQGPMHWYPRKDAWLGKWVTLENDADLTPDEDSERNIQPPAPPNKDKADDGVQVPVPAPHCAPSTFTYTVTITPGAPIVDRYVNVWFDWTRDGDWEDDPECKDGTKAPEWAVQNQVVSGLGPGTHVLVTPYYIPWQPTAVISPTWMRISIAERRAPINMVTQLADGRGPANGYRLGETEDYIFKPDCPTPNADFVWDPPTICPTTTVQFWDTSTGFPDAWAWDFDGLGTSNVQNPTFVFGSVGDYDVTLSVSNICGSDTITKTVPVVDCPDQDKDYDIYIKDSPIDDGSVPSASPYWISPDIWVRTDVTDDCEVETTHQNPIPGTQNKICVRVRNRMTETVDDIDVNVYWANAALGLIWPGSYSHIGVFNIASIAGGMEKVGSVLWNTPYITGHFCLLARAGAPNDPLLTGPDTTPDVNLIQNNNNIAQNNLNIVSFPEVRECGFYNTTVYTEVVYFDAVNTFDTAESVDIEIDSGDFPLGTGTIILDPGSLWEQWASIPGFSKGANTLTVTSLPATIEDAPLAAHETVRMTMTIAAEIDDRFTIDVEERIDDKAVGGIQYVRELPRCIYLPIIMKLIQP